MSVIQFYIPGLAADAVHVETMKNRGRDAAIDDVRFGYSDSRDGHGYRCRVTCSVPMAVFLCDRVRELAAASTGELLIECSNAVASILNELRIGPHR